MGPRRTRPTILLAHRSGCQITSVTTLEGTDGIPCSSGPFTEVRSRSRRSFISRLCLLPTALRQTSDTVLAGEMGRTTLVVSTGTRARSYRTHRPRREFRRRTLTAKQIDRPAVAPAASTRVEAVGILVLHNALADLFATLRSREPAALTGRALRVGFATDRARRTPSVRFLGSARGSNTERSAAACRQQP
jgi:hypothetical protein